MGIGYEFFINAIFSVSISYFGIFLKSLLYNPVYSSLKDLDLIYSFAKKVSKRAFWDKIGLFLSIIFFNIIFLSSIKLFVFYMLKINILNILKIVI